MLTLPALSRLELSHISSGWRNYDSVINPHLQNLLLRSHCQLEYLKLISNHYNYGQELVEFLLLTPKLTHLEIDLCDHKKLTIFQSLTPKDGKLSLLPQLTSLCIRTRDLTSLPEPEAIFLGVKSRRAVDLEGQNKRLESFALIVTDPEGKEWKKSFTSKAEPGLRALEENGLKLELQIRL
ncbi:hypothetical protein VKT23_019072 [Stygiomarasmius scandens]|uniref:Uncharacterized protein n=1 Tax=Marasmiellus scandens TaxID=2682957 RepID=A0ABR1IQA9_9AGAR